MLWDISWGGEGGNAEALVYVGSLCWGVAPGRGQSKYVLGSLEYGGVMLEGREKEAEESYERFVDIQPCLCSTFEHSLCD